MAVAVGPTSRPGLHEQNDATQGEHGTRDLAVRNIVSFVLCRVDRPDIQDFLTGPESECTPNHDHDSRDNKEKRRCFHMSPVLHASTSRAI